MSPIKSALLVATLLVSAPAVFAAGTAPHTRGTAQAGVVYDPAQLPAIKGTVAQYSLTPRGDVDGLILADGTEVHFPPFASTRLVFAVKPGDAVTIHGLKAKALPMVMAMSITNDASGATVEAAGRGPMHRPGTAIEASGTVKELLHTPRGEMNGALLSDGTIVRLPPREAHRMKDALAVGKTVFVRGDGYTGGLGKVVAAREIGPDATHLTAVHAPRPEGWHGHRGPGEHRGPGDHHRMGPGMGPGMGGPGSPRPGDMPPPPPRP